MQVGARVNPIYYHEIGLKPLVDMLKRAGAEALEFGMAPGAPEWERRDEIVGLCREGGFAFHFHSRFSIDAFEGEEWPGLAREYLGILDWLKRAGAGPGPAIDVVIHWPQERLDTPHGPAWDALFRKTVRCLSWLAERADPGLRWQLENAPFKPEGHSLGDRHETLLAIRRAVGEDRLGICWDVGHEREWDQAREPEAVTDEFLRAVGHVHLSDVLIQADGTWAAHHPPFYGNVAFGSHFRALARVRYQGPMILEVGRGTRRLGAGPEGLAASVRIIRSIRDAACGHAQSPADA